MNNASEKLFTLKPFVVHFEKKITEFLQVYAQVQQPYYIPESEFYNITV